MVGHQLLALQPGHGQKALAQKSEARVAVRVEFQHVGSDRNIFCQLVGGALQPLARAAQFVLQLALVPQLPQEHGEELSAQGEADDEKIEARNVGQVPADKRTEGMAGGVKGAEGDDQSAHAHGRQAAVNGEQDEDRREDHDQRGHARPAQQVIGGPECRHDDQQRHEEITGGLPLGARAGEEREEERGDEHLPERVADPPVEPRGWQLGAFDDAARPQCGIAESGAERLQDEKNEQQQSREIARARQRGIQFERAEKKHREHGLEAVDRGNGGSRPRVQPSRESQGQLSGKNPRPDRRPEPQRHGQRDALRGEEHRGDQDIIHLHEKTRVAEQEIERREHKRLPPVGAQPQLHGPRALGMGLRPVHGTGNLPWRHGLPQCLCRRGILTKGNEGNKGGAAHRCLHAFPL